MNFFHSEQLQYTPQDILSMFLWLCNVLFQKSPSSHRKEKSEADGVISGCSLGCFTIARTLAWKIFMETTHPAGGSKRDHYLVCMNDRGQATGGAGSAGWHREPDISPHTDTGEGCNPREGLLWEEIGMSPSPASTAGGAERSQSGASIAPRSCGQPGRCPSRGKAAGGRRRPGALFRSCGWADEQQRLSGDGRLKGRGRSREAARSFWLPEPAPSAAARPRPLPEGAHGSGRLSADCRKLNLSP